jgi:cell filamentation protein
VIFDPFGDFATRGYLRNLAKAKDPEIVRRLQHNSFMTGLDEALAKLRRRSDLAMATSLAHTKSCSRRYSRGPAKTV